mgnify:CR=1 FL=1
MKKNYEHIKQPAIVFSARTDGGAEIGERGGLISCHLFYSLLFFSALAACFAACFACFSASFF